MKLNDEVKAELASRYEGKALPTAVSAELWVKRPVKGAEDKVITKLQLFKLDNKNGIGVAEILSSWSVEPIKKGDIIFK